MNVLSLFDGIGCGRVALERAGIKVDKYYASKIDKYAIQVSQKNWPDIVQLGDVITLNTPMLLVKNIDLLIGGSPCTDLSIAKKTERA
jgi:site-specific DNA-cytosine methylase